MNFFSGNNLISFSNSLNPDKISNQMYSNKKKSSTDIINDFSSIVRSNLDNVNTLEKKSENLTKKLITGEVDNIHEVMIAAEKAKLSLQFTTEVRNKILTAYQDIMRMPI